MPHTEITEAGSDKKISLLDIWKTEVAYRQSLRRRKKAQIAFNQSKTTYDSADAELMAATSGYMAKKRFLDQKEEEIDKLDKELNTERNMRDELRNRMNAAYETHKNSKKELDEIGMSIGNRGDRVNANKNLEAETKKAIELTNAEITKVEKTRNELIDTQKSLRPRIDDLKKQCEVSISKEEKDLEEVKTELSLVQDKIAKAEEKSDSIRAEIRNIEDEYIEAGEGIDHIKEDIRNAEADLGTHKENIIRLDYRAEKLMAESNELVRRAEGLADEFHNLELKLEQQRDEAKKDLDSYIYKDKLDELAKKIREFEVKAQESHKLDEIDEFATTLAQYNFYQKIDKPDVKVTFSPWKMSSFEGDSSMYMSITYSFEGEESESIYLSFKAMGDNKKSVVRGRWEYLNPVYYIVFYRRTPESFTGEIPVFKTLGEVYYNSEEFASNSSTDYVAKIRLRQSEVNKTLKEIEKQKQERTDLVQKTEDLKIEAKQKAKDSEECRNSARAEEQELGEKEQKIEELKNDLQRAEDILAQSQQRINDKKAELIRNEERITDYEKEQEPYIRRRDKLNALIDEKYGSKKSLKDELDSYVSKFEKAGKDIKDCDKKQQELEEKLAKLKEREDKLLNKNGELDNEERDMADRKIELMDLIKKTQKEMDSIDGELDAKANTVKYLESEKARIQAEMDELANEAGSRKGRYDDATAAFESAKTAYEAAQKELEDSMTQVDFNLKLQKSYIGRFLTRS